MGGVGAGAGAAEEAGAGAAPGGAGGEQSGTPSHLQRLRKRKLRGGDSALHKRRSSVGDAVLLSLSGNLLDCTPSPDGKQLLEGQYCYVTGSIIYVVYIYSGRYLCNIGLI